MIPNHGWEHEPYLVRLAGPVTSAWLISKSMPRISQAYTAPNKQLGTVSHVRQVGDRQPTVFLTWCQLGSI